MPAKLHTPASVLCAELEFEGRRYLLALVRTWWLDEGSAIFEAQSSDGADSIAAEFGTWTVKRSDQGPATLAIDMMLPEDLTNETKQLADRLMAELVRLGGAWGLESYEACS